ncbi:beta-N-acetylhexosaminidase isoform X2 [Neoarius graeffei]|uniref:beta-N-acetylhexosaminidase isoform X2 n=1 Tax=Neoarius graeffei TaxID=443677 RepID=UPI00298C9042|nr:beta-N-acetylhexosaminidase isoform X2 [Neoarius graeffei]
MGCKRNLKLLVTCLVLLAAGSLFRSRRTKIEKYLNYKKNVMMTGIFWQPENVATFDNVIVPATTQEIKEAKKDQMTITEPNLEVKRILKASVKPHTSPLRIVHLDLKGAAPKVSYFQQLFPLIASLGADGILLEYEDMFPYEGDLEILRSRFAYSVKEIEEITTLASLYNLEVIPLVQVFGHLEFVLKHRRFFHLREVADFPNSLNPVVPDSLKLVKEMLTQVLNKHPKTRWLHIGADEVYGLGTSEDSKNWLKQNSGGLGALFLSHVTKVCHFLAELKPGIKLIFWEDMIRKVNASILKESGIQSLASPMIWKYDSNMNLSHIGQLLSNYKQAGFHTVWFASSFKGSSGIDQRWTPLNHHLMNHLAWLKVMASMSGDPSLQLVGIALTGWQRYAHHTVLCELLPVAIPSLAICLQSLKYGSFNHTAESEVQSLLGCKVNLAANSCQGNGSFAGADVYYMIQKIHNELQKSTEKVTEHIVLEEWNSFLETFKLEMMAIYYPDTVDEWMEQHINPHMDKLYSLAKDIDRIIKFKGQPKTYDKLPD